MKVWQALIPAMVVTGTVLFILTWSGIIKRWIRPPIKKDLFDMQDIEDYANNARKDREKEE